MKQEKQEEKDFRDYAQEEFSKNELDEYLEIKPLLNYIIGQIQMHPNLPVVLSFAIVKGKISFYQLQRLTKSEFKELDEDSGLGGFLVASDKNKTNYIG
jgi:hypothetical protein